MTTEKYMRRLLREREWDRQRIRGFIAHHEEESRRTSGCATANSRAEHVRDARLGREELQRRSEQEVEARRVLKMITGEASHAPLYDLFSGALAVDCDAAIEAALRLWTGSQAGHGPFPALDVASEIVAGWRSLLDAYRDELRMRTEPQIEAARAEPASAELTEAEKAKLRARARRAQDEETREDGNGKEAA